jgi:hypothetical protein
MLFLAQFKNTYFDFFYKRFAIFPGSCHFDFASTYVSGCSTALCALYARRA